MLIVVVLLSFFLTQTIGNISDLGEALSNSRFLNNGLVNSSSKFVFNSIDCDYLEAENVTCVHCRWFFSNGCVYLFEETDKGFISPPVGMRSSVPLGGLGAGAMELRADGTFHEVNIQNQHPASSAKYGVLQDFILGFDVAGDSRLIRTSAPFGKGVESINYSGSYPLSRLSIVDSTLDQYKIDLFAYSKLKPTDSVESSVPAIIFSLTVENLSDEEIVASLFLNLPFAAVNDCFRIENDNTTITHHVKNYQRCLHLCAQSKTCASWNFDEIKHTCSQNIDVPLSIHKPSSYCGIKGSWKVTDEVLTLNMSPVAQMNPSSGNVSITTISSNDNVTISSFGLGTSVDALFSSFSKGNGEFVNSPDVIDFSPSSGEFVSSHGAAAVKTLIDAHSTKTISIVFTWFFPDRDHVNLFVGNYYSNLATSSQVFAKELKSSMVLTQIVNDINSHHYVFSNNASSLPLWLQDHMVNQMSHFRGMMYLKDARMREYEANDCVDIDSIHNDYQRHLPYIWYFPNFEESKLMAWSKSQTSEGYLMEDLADFDLSPMDTPGDRIMGDTTSLWVIEQYEFFKNTGNKDSLASYYSIITKALHWMIDNANVNDNQGLPYKLPCSYDIIAFDQYNATTFNSMIYLAALRAGEEIAKVMNDYQNELVYQAAFKIGQNQIYKLLWNDTENYFRAYIGNGEDGNNALMSDCLYGVMVAHYNGLGFLVDEDKLRQHLIAELRLNGDEFGLKVVTGRHNKVSPTEKDKTNDPIWMGGAPDWAYLSIALNQNLENFDLDTSLLPLKKQLINYSENLAEIWNWPGLTSPSSWGKDGGLPYITSHYGFVMTDYYLLPLLSGQNTNIQNQSLSFWPVYSCPFNLPLLLSSITGVVSCKIAQSFSSSNEVYSVEIKFGRLSLKKNGLSINGSYYPNVVSLGSGESVSWSSNQKAASSIM